MPQLPLYNSQRQITEKVPRPMLGDELTSTAQQGRKAIQVMEKLKTAHDTMQYITAKRNYTSRLNDILQRAGQDPDVNNYDTYAKELQTAYQESMEGLSDGEIKQKATIELENSVMANKLKLGNLFFKKQTNQGRVNLNDSYNELYSSYLNGENSALDEAKNLVSTGFKGGILTPEKTNQYNDDLEIWNTKRNKYLTNLQDRTEKELERQKKEAKRNAIQEQYIKQSYGTYDPAEAEQLLREKIIDIEDLDKMNERWATPPVETDYAVYNELMSDIKGINDFDNNTENDLNKVVQKIQNNSKKLKEEQLRTLITQAQNISETKKNKEIKNQAAGLKAWANQVIGGEFTDEQITGIAKGKIEELVYQFYERVNRTNAQGEQIKEIKDAIIKEYYGENYPSINNLEDVPDVILDAKGKVTRLTSPSKKKKSKATYTITRNKEEQ